MTLAELLLVCGILALMTAVSVPFLMTFWRTSTLRAGAQELQAVLNTARHLAIKENRSVCVTNDGTRVQYRVGGCAGQPWTGSVTDGSGNVTLSNTVRVTGSTANVTFTYLGAASQAGTYTVQNPVDGASITVTVAASGRITIP